MHPEACTYMVAGRNDDGGHGRLRLKAKWFKLPEIVFLWMKPLLFLWYFLFMSAVLFGKERDPIMQHSDSLLNKIKKAGKTEYKIHGLLDLSFFWSDYDTAKAFYYIRQAERLMPVQRMDNYHRGLLAFYQGAAYFDAEPEIAKRKYLEAEKYLVKSHRPLALRYRVRLWGSYGALLQRGGHADEYVQVLLNKAIPLAKQIADTVLVANNYQNVALVLMNQQQYNKAGEYYSQALTLLRYQSAAHEERLTAFVNYARNALFNNQQELARKLLDSAVLIASKVPSSAYLPMYYSVEGTYWQKAGQKQKALSCFEKGLNAASRLGTNHLTNYILYEEFRLHKSSHDLVAARNVLHRVLEYVSRGNSLHDKQAVYYDLAQTESEMGNYKVATHWYEQYKLATDTLITKAGADRVLELEKKFQTAEKENELLKLKTHNQHQQIALERNKMLVTVLTGIALLAVVISVMIYKSHQHRKRLAIQKEKLLQEELKTIKQQEQIHLYNAMVQGQEKERNRIARDLHDGLGGMLAGVKLKLSAFATKIESNTVNNTDMELYHVISQLDHSVSELRRIARNMMPESLLYMGLEPALRDLCQSMNTESLRVTFEAFNLRTDYHQPFLIAIYRIVQELLTNAVKHAEASAVMVQASEHEGRFYITIEDDGKGFDPDTAGTDGGIGFSNIRTRVEILKGTMEIKTERGVGSTFNIDVSIHE